jgi:hypothetical protein
MEKDKYFELILERYKDIVSVLVQDDLLCLKYGIKEPSMDELVSKVIDRGLAAQFVQDLLKRYLLLIRMRFMLVPMCGQDVEITCKDKVMRGKLVDVWDWCAVIETEDGQVLTCDLLKIDLAKCLT